MNNMENELTEDEIDTIFFALSDRTRRALLRKLSEGDATISELCIPFSMTMPAIMKHLRILGEAGFVTAEKEGKIRRCHFEGQRLAVASELLMSYQRFWEDKLGALEKYLLAMDEKN